MQLQVDPFVDAHRAHALRVAGSRAEREAIEHLLNLLVGKQLARLERRLPRRRGGRNEQRRKPGMTTAILRIAVHS